MIKCLYHCSSKYYLLAQEMGFNMVEISLNAWPASWNEIPKALDQAHSIGLDVMLDLQVTRDIQSTFNFISLDSVWSTDIIILMDEPNFKKYSPELLKNAHNKIKILRPEIKTMITLSPIRSFNGYEKIADIVGISYYEAMTNYWKLFMLWKKIKCLKRKFNGEIIAIPGVKNDENYMIDNYCWWRKWIKPNGYAWYSFTPNEEKPPWAQAGLENIPEWQKILKRLNMEN